ncbi:hypothetical protein [uncultured Sphingomonas sp.]|uniref:hypothetical protein n=1 Tax=uncultured Sphingomonas sp. TaxID=158754 RepID=UPI0025DD8274|nr:hypothetical protein [uncultured Sphingomonas sp.]
MFRDQAIACLNVAGLFLPSRTRLSKRLSRQVYGEPEAKAGQRQSKNAIPQQG